MLMNRFVILSCALGAIAVSSSSASAQLVFGARNSTSGSAGAFYLNVDTSVATPLWPQTNNKRPNGFAADVANHKLYVVDSARLSVWEFGTQPAVPQFVSANGGLYRTDAAGNLATGVDGLAFANGSLYGWTNTSTTRFDDGIYKITTSGTFAGQMTPQWLNDDVYDFEGLDFNLADGMFYATNTRSTGGQAVGVYKIDALNNANAVPQFVTGFDTSLGLPASWDGMAVGGGALWLTQYVNGTATDNSDDRLYISKYDLATGEYVDAFGLALPNGSQVGSGATWAPGALTYVPEPTALGFAAATMSLIVRRRR